MVYTDCVVGRSTVIDEQTFKKRFVASGKELKVQFQPLDMDNRAPRVFLRTNSETGAIAESLCWGYIGKQKGDSCVMYVHGTGDTGFADKVSDPRDIPRFYSDFAHVYHTTEGSVWRQQTPLGEFKLIRFYLFSGAFRKNCFAFVNGLRSTDQNLVGWYCASIHTDLTPDLIEQIVPTIGINGVYDPERITYVKPVPSTGTWSDKRVCSSAITRQSPFEWKTGSHESVGEAKRRGITSEECAAVLGRVGE